ncbi:protein TPLATE [Tanacetum coccineum]
MVRNLRAESDRMYALACICRTALCVDLFAKESVRRGQKPLPRTAIASLFEDTTIRDDLNSVTSKNLFREELVATLVEKPSTNGDASTENNSAKKLTISNHVQAISIVTNVDTVLKRMDEKCLKSYRVLDTKFYVKKLMEDMCECFLDILVVNICHPMSMAQQQMASKTCAAGEHMPPIIHCDLKSLNLPVDKKWTVKAFTQTHGSGQAILLEFIRNKEETYFIAADVLQNICSHQKGVERLRGWLLDSVNLNIINHLFKCDEEDEMGKCDEEDETGSLSTKPPDPRAYLEPLGVASFHAPTSIVRPKSLTGIYVLLVSNTKGAVGFR